MNQTRYKSLNERLEALHDLVFDLPLYFYIKDLKGRYLYLNKSTADAAECPKSLNLVGKTDFESPWAEFYEPFIKRADSAVIKEGTSYKHTETTMHQKKLVVVSTHKKPFYHNGELVGLCGTSTEIPPELINQSTPYSEQIEFIDLKRSKKVVLTKRQKQTLYFTLKGYTAAETAERLNLSKRTVEHYIANIKDVNDYDSVREMMLAVRAVS